MKQTPLHALHIELGAKMVPFAGYEMPVQYPLGVMAEHNHTRQKAGLFDVSHMGQMRLSGRSWDSVALAFETLVPQDVLGLADGRQRYGFFTNDAGGIEDDLMFARQGNDLVVVVNAACKHDDFARMAALQDVTATPLEDRALLALQGPAAGTVMARQDALAETARFMDLIPLTVAGINGWATRSGYTGEDGFELSVPAADAEQVARALLSDPDVEAIGLGARDSLRLEAGLCLYGHDIDTRTTPAEAGLGWAVQKARKPGGSRAGGFPGADLILQAPVRKRVGLKPLGRAPMREGTELFTPDKQHVGAVTSGGFGPTVNGPVAMGYVTADMAEIGTQLLGEVRGKQLPVEVVSLPFVPARFKR